MSGAGIDPREFATGGSRLVGFHLIAACSRCPNHTILATTNQALARILCRDLGWKLGERRSRDQCPTCAAPRPKGPFKLTPKDTPMAAAPTAPPVPLRPIAEPPRQPTLEDRRRIRQALDAQYDDGAGHYTGDGSDATLALTLKVPRAWVATIRELYGPDASASDKARNKELDDAAKLARAATERLIVMAAEAEAIATSLEGARKLAA